MKKSSRKTRIGAGKTGRSFHAERRRPRFSREVSVLYEDEAVIVVNKPPGLLAVPVKDSEAPSALSVVSASLEEQRERALIVHRIDRFVSGALLFAKTSDDRNVLIRQFLAHTPIRRYLAVVRGRLEAETATLVHHLRKQGMVQHLRPAKDPQAARAELRYSVARHLTNASLLRVELVTGLQNQIRAQFSAIGHPVVGDRKYHPEESTEPLIARVALHAAYLEFIHPRSGERIAIDCKPPRDFEDLVRELSRPGRARR